MLVLEHYFPPPRTRSTTARAAWLKWYGIFRLSDLDARTLTCSHKVYKLSVEQERTTIH